MTKKLRLNVGDIFTIPLGNGEMGFGQIVSFPRSKDVFIMIVFDQKMSENENYDIDKIIKSDILFLGYTTDAKLYHKHWNIIDNSNTNIASIVMPYYRLGTPPHEIYLINYKSECICKVSEEEFNQLDYLTNYAPIRYENALKAFYKLQEWKAGDYNQLLYEKVLKSNEIARSILKRE